MKKRRRGRGQQTHSKWAYVGLAGVMVVVVAMAAFAVVRSTSSVPISESRYTPAPEETTPPPPLRVELAAALQGLEDPTQEFDIVIFGDSTGVSANGWQVLIPRWLGETFERQVTLHPWNRDVNSYAQSWGLGFGADPGVTVWNGSSPSRDTVYAREQQAAIAPLPAEDVDVVFVNFGHTEPRHSAARKIASFMDDAALTYPNAAIVYLKQNPDISGSPLVEIQDYIVDATAHAVTERDFEVIPVWEAFKASSDLDSLLDAPTMIHPNDAGYRVWADAMIAYITPLLPQQ